MLIGRQTRLKERGTSVFCAGGKAVPHFHEDQAGIFAVVRHGEAWLRFPINTAPEPARLLQSIAEALGSEGAAPLQEIRTGPVSLPVPRATWLPCILLPFWRRRPWIRQQHARRAPR